MKLWDAQGNKLIDSENLRAKSVLSDHLNHSHFIDAAAKLHRNERAALGPLSC